jgi:hypothetical protein
VSRRSGKHGVRKPSRTYDGGEETERGILADPNMADYTQDEVEFMLAMDKYKRDNERPFPAWSEVLEVLRDLGYRKG